MFYLTDSFADTESEVLCEDEDFLDRRSSEFQGKICNHCNENSLINPQPLEMNTGMKNDSVFEDEDGDGLECACSQINITKKQNIKYLACPQQAVITESISYSGFVDSEHDSPLTIFQDKYNKSPVVLHSHSACQFGSVMVRDVFNNFPDEVPNKYMCVCSGLKYDVSDCLDGWEPTPKTHYKHSRNAKHRKYPHGSSNPFSRLYSFTEIKNICYEFHHYVDTKRYMEQYRMYHTVGDIHRKALASLETEERSDCYVPKMNSNMCAIAENCDLLAIVSLDRDSSFYSSSTENLSNKSFPVPGDHRETEEVRLNRTKERPVNLVPVREFSVPDLGNPNGAKKNYIALSQYLDLAVPEATILPDEKNTEKSTRMHNAFVNRRRRCRFKTSLGYDSNTQGAESPHSPQNGSASTLKSRQTQIIDRHVDIPNERAGSADLPKPKPPSIIRLVVTAHGNREKNEQKQKNLPTPTSQGLLYVGSTVNKEPESARPPFSKRHPLNLCQMHCRRLKCCERLHEILSHSAGDKREERKELDKIPKKLDSHEQLPETSFKPDRILSVPIKPLGIQGKNYKSEEQLTVIYRLQKEKNAKNKYYSRNSDLDMIA